MKKFSLSLLSAFWLLPAAFSQRLGINTTSPLETLDVRGNGYFSDKLGIGITNPQFPLSFSPTLGDKISLWGNSGPNYGLGIQSYLLQVYTDASASDIAFGHGSSASFTENMRIKGNGNVGIGTNDPLAKLHVKDSSVLFSASGGIPLNPGNPPIEGQGRRMMWYSDKAAFRVGLGGTTSWNKDNIGDYSVAMGYLTTSSSIYSTAMGGITIASAVGATAMGFKTEASGGNSIAMGAQTKASGHYSTAMGWGMIAKAMGGVSLGMFNDDSDNPDSISQGSLDRIFQIGNGGNVGKSNAMTVLRNGNVGIGTVSPTSTLDVMRGTAAEGTAQFRGTDNISHFNFGTSEDTYIRGGKNGAHVILNDFRGAGNVGIGTGFPSQKLHVAGNICATGTIGACSDIRYKKDIISINNSLSSVLALNGIYYYWKKNEFPDMQFTGNRQVGFSAQEMEKLFPEMVMTDANGYKSVDYGRLTPVLVEAIKEQQEQINAQQQQIDELKKDKLQIQEQIAELKKMMEKILK